MRSSIGRAAIVASTFLSSAAALAQPDRPQRGPPIELISSPALDGKEAYCLIGQVVKITASYASHRVPAGTQLEWTLEPPHGNRIEGDRKYATFTAGNSPGIVRVVARWRGEQAGGERAELTIVVWSISRAEDAAAVRVSPKRANLDSTWATFYWHSRPDEYAQTILRSGLITIKKLEPGADGRKTSFWTRFSRKSGALEIDFPVDRDNFRVKPEELRWRGWRNNERLDPGRYRLVLKAMRGDHHAAVEYEILYDPFPGPQSLDGFWRLTSGPSTGWLLRGRTHGEGLVSLDTAPGVVIAGQFGSGDYDAAVDLERGFGGVAPIAGTLDDHVRPPIVIARLSELRIGEDRHSLSFEAQYEGARITARRVPWSVAADASRSARWFDPASPRPAERRARVVLRRSPVPFASHASDENVVVRARILAADGHAVEEALWKSTDSPSPSPGRLTIEASGDDRIVGWSGLNALGARQAPGEYSIELTVREGMAEEIVRHPLILGEQLKITEMPVRFAPGHESLPIRFSIEPASGTPRRTWIVISGGRDQQEKIVEREVNARRDGDSWLVEWDGTGVDNSTVRWAKLGPFRVEVRADVRGEGTTAADARPCRVELAAVEIAANPPRYSGLEGTFYGPRDLSADDELLPVVATVKLISSRGATVAVQRGFDLIWDYVWERSDNRLPPPRVNRGGGTSQARREPAFFAAVGGRRLGGRKVKVDVALDSTAVSFLTPARAETWDIGRVRGDKFRVLVQVDGITAEDRTPTTPEYLVAPGRPALVRQMSASEVRSIVPEQQMIGETWTKKLYVENMATKVATFINTSLPETPFRPRVPDRLIRGLFAEYRDFSIRFLGDVPGVPQQLDEANRATIALPVFYGGIAGGRQSEVRGGQAVLAAFEVKDAFGNPVPVFGSKARRLVASVRDVSGGVVPPFVLSSPTGSAPAQYGGAIPLFPLRTPPEEFRIGVLPFFYVPGVVFEAAPQLAREYDALRAELRRYREIDLDPPFESAIDDALTVAAFVGDQRVASSDGIRLFDPDSFARRPTEMQKLLKWAVAGEVADVETLRLEIITSVMPVVGDGRDLAIQMLKQFFGAEVTGWDRFFATMAAVGLFLDLGDVTVAGVLPNAFVAAIKSFGKYAQSVFRGGAKLAGAVLEAFAPLMRAAQRAAESPGPAAFRALAKEIEELKEFSLFLRELADESPAEFERRLQKIGEFVERCNPHTCLVFLENQKKEVLKSLSRLEPEELLPIKRLWDKVVATRDVRSAQAVTRDLATLADRLRGAGQQTEASSMALRHIAELAALTDNPFRFIDNLKRLPAQQLAELAEVVGRRNFQDAVLRNPALMTTLMVGLGRPYAAKMIAVFRKGASTADDFLRLGRVVDLLEGRLDELADLLGAVPAESVAGMVAKVGAAFAPSQGMLPLWSVGGARGASDVLFVMAELAKRGSLGSAEKVVSIAADIRRVAAPADDTLKLSELKKLFQNKGWQSVRGRDGRVRDLGRDFAVRRFEQYVDAVDYFRRDGRAIPGLLEPARNAEGTSERATAHLRRVSSSANPAHEALEVVGTKYLIEHARNLRARSFHAGSGVEEAVELAILKEGIVAFGFKGASKPVTGTVTTFEADVLIHTADGRWFFLDWKNWRADLDQPGVKPPSLFRTAFEKAVNALRTALTGEFGADRAVANIIYLRTTEWPKKDLELLREIWRTRSRNAPPLPNAPGGRNLVLSVLDAMPGSSIYRFLFGE